MTGDRALELLIACLRGGASMAPEEVDELVHHGFVVVVDTARVKRVHLYALVARPPFDLARATKDLATVEERLQSDFTRMLSSSSSLRKDETRRSRLRALVGALRDPVEADLVRTLLHTLADVPADAPWTALDGGESVALSHLGRRAAAALYTRRARFGATPFAEFAKVFGKADRTMAALGVAYAEVVTGIRGKVPKGVEGAAIGLLKAGLSSSEAIARFGDASRHVQRSLLAVEQPHRAVAIVRGSRAGDMAGAAARLAAASKALRAVGFADTPVVRGAARAIADAPDPTVAAIRVRRLWDGISATGDLAVKLAARLYAAPGAAFDIVERLHFFQQRVPIEVAAVLAASCADPTELQATLDRWNALQNELVARRAFSRGQVSPLSAELVALALPVPEVVDLLQQLVAHLPARESAEAWGTSADWAPAVAFARRCAW